MSRRRHVRPPWRAHPTFVVALILGLTTATGTRPVGAQTASASEPSAVARAGTGSRDDGPSPSGSRRHDFLELGLAAHVVVDPRERADADEKVEGDIALVVSGALYFGRFFVESLGGVAGPLNPDGLNIGVTLLDGDRFSADLLLVSGTGIAAESGDGSGDPTAADDADRRNAYLLERGTLELASGLRLTRYAGDWIGQLRVVRTVVVEPGDTADGHGIDGTLRVGRQWPLRRWLLRGVGGLRYVSGATNRAIWGIGTDEATDRFPRHDAGAGVDLDLELDATRPLARDWVFRSTVRLRLLSDAVRDSPLVEDAVQAELVGGINYVF